MCIFVTEMASFCNETVVRGTIAQTIAHKTSQFMFQEKFKIRNNFHFSIIQFSQ